ncbi:MULTISPECIES: SRPBCC family protein [Halostella]|uniref:SRPBCC family protein n=1 Tax=Halostella TaxID=1843185 RepID=UPI001081E3EC|nr:MULTISPECIES: SRPBCC family protein [Halostella]
METVSVTRTTDGSAAAVTERFDDRKEFMEAAGFDEVTVDGDRIQIANNVGLATMELTVDVVETDAAFAYEQVDGLFEEMVTRYEITEANGETTIAATTEFEIAAPFVGKLLDATVITRQRRRELVAQLSYLDPNDSAET